MKISTITTALTLSLAVTAMAGDAAQEKPRVDRSSRAETTEALFTRYDTDKDGTITAEEFRGGKMLFEAYDLDRNGALTREEVEKAKKPNAPNFRALDADKDGFVTRREWQGTQEEFDAVDLDHDGVWSRADRAIEKHRTQATGLIERLDADKDGKISVEEWNGDSGSFRQRDLNRDGSLDLDELSMAVK